MNSQKLLTLGVICVGLALLATSALGQKMKATQAFMRQKLVYSQGILEGMTLERYELVITNARKLANMSLSNTWFAIRNPEYMKYTQDFHTNVVALMDAAREKKLHDTTEAYIGVIHSCVDCHQYFRVEQRYKKDRVDSPRHQTRNTPGTYPLD